jgi:hypothetical protein
VPGCGTQWVNWPSQRYRYGATAILSLRARNPRLGRIGPVDGELPREHRAVLQHVLELNTASRHHHVRRTCRRQRGSIDIGVVQKIDAVDDEALFGRRLALEHPAAIGDTRMLLDDVVARAGRHVVAVAPHRRPRIVGKERPQELVAIVRAHRIVARADRITHRVRALRTGRSAPAALTGRCRWRRRRRGWIEERLCGSWLIGTTGRTEVRVRTRRPGRRLIRSNGTSPEEGHHDQPALGDLIVSDYGVAVVRCLALPAEAAKEIGGLDRTVENLPGDIELPALLREDRGARVHDLDDVIGADGEGVVGWVADRRPALRALESDAEAVDARDNRGRRSSPGRRLFHGGRSSRYGDHRRDDRCVRLLTGNKCSKRCGGDKQAMHARATATPGPRPACSRRRRTATGWPP